METHKFLGSVRVQKIVHTRRHQLNKEYLEFHQHDFFRQEQRVLRRASHKTTLNVMRSNWSHIMLSDTILLDRNGNTPG